MTYPFKQALQVVKANSLKFEAKAIDGEFWFTVDPPIPVLAELFAVLGTVPISGNAEKKYYTWTLSNDNLAPTGFYAPQLAIFYRHVHKGNLSVFGWNMLTQRLEIEWDARTDWREWMRSLETRFGRKPKINRRATYYDDFTPEELAEVVAVDDYRLGADSKYFKELEI